MDAPRALTQRPDLLAEEAHRVYRNGLTWRGRFKQLGSYGTSGGSAADRRAIVEYMARLEEK